MQLTRAAQSILQFTFFTAIVSLKAAGDQESVALRFISFPLVTKATPVELLLSKGAVLKVELPSNSISPAYHVERLSKWVLGKTTDSKNKTTFQVYGSAPSIASRQQLILVLRNGRTNSDGFELIPMDYSNDAFGGGQYFIMNAAKVGIAGMIGNKKFALKPHDHTTIHPSPSKVEGDRKYCYAYLYYRKKNKLEPFYSSTWRYSEHVRSMVFLYHDPRTMQLRLHSIRDYLAR